MLKHNIMYLRVTCYPVDGFACHYFLQVYLVKCEVWILVLYHSECWNLYWSLKTSKLSFRRLRVYEFVYLRVTCYPVVEFVYRFFLQVYLVECEVWILVLYHSKCWNLCWSLKTSNYSSRRSKCKNLSICL